MCVPEVWLAKWSDERKDALRSMWLAGSTSTDISVALGDVSRNAVMGMVHRMGLMGNPDHAARSTARRSGCCAQGWQRSGQDVEAGAVVTEMEAAEASVTVQPVETAPAPVMVDDVAVSTVIASDPVVEPDTLDDDVPVAAEGRTDPVDVETVSVEPSVLHEVAAEAPTSEADPYLLVEQAAVESAAVPDDATDPVQPVLDESPQSPREAANDEGPSLGAADVQERSVEPQADDAATATAKGVDRIRRVMQAKKKPAARTPSSRPWQPVTSRMPPRPRDVAPPPEVVISSGVMSALRSLQPGSSEWRDAFTLLRDLTGVPYDARVPGHMPALVAIATVMARGDPRSILSPRIPEQSVLRMMRSFAEKGIVVAGKPPSRWIEDVDDRAFYDEMVQLAAAA
jgi:hypothetical protein